MGISGANGQFLPEGKAARLLLGEFLLGPMEVFLILEDFLNNLKKAAWASSRS